MIEKNLVYDFLNNLRNQRMTKDALEKKLQTFFSVDNHLLNSTDEGNFDIDYAFIYTTGYGFQSHNVIDIEISYLPTRADDVILITYAELLTYEP